MFYQRNDGFSSCAPTAHDGRSALRAKRRRIDAARGGGPRRSVRRARAAIPSDGARDLPPFVRQVRARGRDRARNFRAALACASCLRTGGKISALPLHARSQPMPKCLPRHARNGTTRRSSSFARPGPSRRAARSAAQTPGRRVPRETARRSARSDRAALRRRARLRGDCPRCRPFGGHHSIARLPRAAIGFSLLFSTDRTALPRSPATYRK